MFGALENFIIYYPNIGDCWWGGEGWEVIQKFQYESFSRHLILEVLIKDLEKPKLEAYLYPYPYSKWRPFKIY